MPSLSSLISPQLAFLLVAFSLGSVGDGLNIFQGVYLVQALQWPEGAVGAALSLMGLTTLIIQPVAGDWVDKCVKFDRRLFLVVAALATALSASTILVIRPGNHDHALLYTSKVIEGVASSFIGPCLAALTLATFGPHQFDAIMASNILWGHVGSVVAAVVSGLVAFVAFPNIEYCFLVIGASALIAIVFVPYLPQGDPLLGRGLAVSSTENTTTDVVNESTNLLINPVKETEQQQEEAAPSSYIQVFLDRKTCVLCITGFFFQYVQSCSIICITCSSFSNTSSFSFANANVLLVLGELMGGPPQGADNGPSRMAIPLTAGAVITAQFTMTIATWLGGSLTDKGVGRKPLFMACLLSLPLRCALILLWRNWGNHWLLSTQIFDGVGGGFFGLIHPFLVADITFGTGRFNVVMGLTASCFGMGATLSNFLGQLVVQHFGHEASLVASLIISIIPIGVFASFMPETMGHRVEQQPQRNDSTRPCSPNSDNSSYESFQQKGEVSSFDV